MPEGWGVLISTFALLFVAELGDKTQLAVISMAAKYRMPLPVFSGAVLALVAVTLIGVLGCEALTRFIPTAFLQKGAAVLFILMGLLMWFDRL